MFRFCFAPRSFRRGVVLASCLGFFVIPAVQAQELAAPGALGADMLPKGRSAVRLETRRIWAKDEFDSHGDRQALLSEYNGLKLDSSIFPALGFFGPGASLGTTDLSARMTGTQRRKDVLVVIVDAGHHAHGVGRTQVQLRDQVHAIAVRQPQIDQRQIRRRMGRQPGASLGQRRHRAHLDPRKTGAHRLRQPFGGLQNIFHK